MTMAALMGFTTAARADSAVTLERIRNSDKYPGDWLTYHRDYKGWQYSPLDQVSAKNVGKLQVAWTHAMPRSVRGLQSMPLAVDGVVYYSGAYNQVFALDGTTGEVIWYYRQKLNEDLVARQTHSPYNRGLAIGLGHVYMGTLDGKLVALDQKTGELSWETKLIDSERLTVGFTGAPLFVKDKVIIGAQGGEWPYRGPIFGVDARSGQEVWKFYTVGGNNDTKSDARNTWGNDSWQTGGGGGWMPGNYDAQTNIVWWGTGNPAPLYDWSGPDFMTGGARPGSNLYTTSVIGLDPDTGDLKAYHQELPHDAWDFDSAVGEFVMLERAGRKYMVHPNKSGFVFVYDRQGKVQNVWRLVKHINFVQDIRPDGTLVGRRDLTEGSHQGLCPFIAGGISWNAGSYNPKTGLYYKVGNEWCMDLTVQRTAPITEPMAQLNIGASFSLVNPPGEKAYGHVSAHDPLTGAKKWEVRFPEPPLASLLSTAGNLLFVPDARGYLRAFDAGSGKELWKHNNGQGHNGGIISYKGKDGKQYIAVAAGWGGLAGDDYASFFGKPFNTFPKDSGQLIVFSLP
jgi:PQQ-dependent dehydrogenase (methanol/ethanol family)